MQNFNITMNDIKGYKPTPTTTPNMDMTQQGKQIIPVSKVSDAEKNLEVAQNAYNANKNPGTKGELDKRQKEYDDAVANQYQRKYANVGRDEYHSGKYSNVSADQIAEDMAKAEIPIKDAIGQFAGLGRKNDKGEIEDGLSESAIKALKKYYPKEFESTWQNSTWNEGKMEEVQTKKEEEAKQQAETKPVDPGIQKADTILKLQQKKYWITKPLSDNLLDYIYSEMLDPDVELQEIPTPKKREKNKTLMEAPIGSYFYDAEGELNVVTKKTKDSYLNKKLAESETNQAKVEGDKKSLSLLEDIKNQTKIGARAVDVATWEGLSTLTQNDANDILEAIDNLASRDNREMDKEFKRGWYDTLITECNRRIEKGENVDVLSDVVKKAQNKLSEIPEPVPLDKEAQKMEDNRQDIVEKRAATEVLATSNMIPEDETVTGNVTSETLAKATKAFVKSEDKENLEGLKKDVEQSGDKVAAKTVEKAEEEAEKELAEQKRKEEESKKNWYTWDDFFRDIRGASKKNRKSDIKGRYKRPEKSAEEDPEKDTKEFYDEMAKKREEMDEETRNSIDQQAIDLQNQIENSVDPRYVKNMPKWLWESWKDGDLGRYKVDDDLKEKYNNIADKENPTEEEQKIIDSYNKQEKEARESKRNFGSFLLDSILTGLSNSFSILRGQEGNKKSDINKITEANLSSAIERRNKKYDREAEEAMNLISSKYRNDVDIQNTIKKVYAEAEVRPILDRMDIESKRRFFNWLVAAGKDIGVKDVLSLAIGSLVFNNTGAIPQMAMDVLKGIGSGVGTGLRLITGL